MNEDFITYELAKKLKEKGFDYPCIGHYVNNKLYIAHYQNAFHSDNDESVDAPTISQVLKWLRNTYNLHVETYPCVLGMWKFLVTNITTLEERALCDKYTSSEQSALAGIEYVFDNLI